MFVHLYPLITAVKMTFGGQKRLLVWLQALSFSSAELQSVEMFEQKKVINSNIKKDKTKNKTSQWEITVDWCLVWGYTAQSNLMKISNLKTQSSGFHSVEL